MGWTTAKRAEPRSAADRHANRDGLRMGVPLGQGLGFGRRPLLPVRWLMKSLLPCFVGPQTVERRVRVCAFLETSLKAFT